MFIHLVMPEFFVVIQPSSSTSFSEMQVVCVHSVVAFFHCAFLFGCIIGHFDCGNSRAVVQMFNSIIVHNMLSVLFCAGMVMEDGKLLSMTKS